jgi:hypothetical protein
MGAATNARSLGRCRQDPLVQQFVRFLEVGVLGRDGGVGLEPYAIAAGYADLRAEIYATFSHQMAPPMTMSAMLRMVALLHRGRRRL